MSKQNVGYGPVPDRWLHCPRKSLVIIQNKFCAFKTPLCSGFNDQVPEEFRFSVKMLFDSLKSQKIKMGLWIDLTNTKRFYDRIEVEETGCRYLKIPCKGRGETPSQTTTNAFVEICRKFIQSNPLEMIGVHCTHGFNRTGFLIISYLVEDFGMSVDAAIAQFSTARPPGIYKSDYIQELYRRYDDVDDSPSAPPRPSWCLENNSDDDDEIGEGSQSSMEENEPPAKRRKREHFHKNPVFMDGVPGVTPLMNHQIMSGIQRRIQDICGWTDGGFPGCQPVSMDVENISFLNKKPYRMSWKADGTRYLMLIQGDGQVYFADRNFSIFEVSGLRFPHARDSTRVLRDTLLDGEMVIDIDKSDGRKYPRYLAYDVLMYDGKDVSKEPFDPVRYNVIEKDIIGGRIRAFKEGRMNKDREPFSVRRKNFYELNWTANILGEKFAKQLGHEPDGLIFQPAKEPYVTGPCPEVLKWKPLSLNSVDFKLKITKEEGLGILPRNIGHLYVGGQSVEFARMKINKQIKELNNKIIECKFENNEWVFMRERTDKTFPNSYKTAIAVCQSIINPVTKEKLLDYIKKYQFRQDDADLMPPPNRIRTVLLWCTKDLSSKDKRSLRVNIEYDHATLIRWSPDGKAFLIHKAVGNAIEVYKISKKADGTLASATKSLEFPKHHVEDVVGMDIACTGRYIATCSTANDLVIWDLKGQILTNVDTYLGSTHKIRISPCGRFVAASGFTPDVKVWEVGFTKSGEFKQVSKAFNLAGHSSGVYDFGFSADTSYMATVSKDGTYRFYDTKIEFEKGEDPRILANGTWESTSTANLALSPNGEVLAIAHGSSLSFYCTVTGSLDTTIDDIFNGSITCLTFDAAGEYLLVAGDKHIKIFRNIPGFRATIESSRRKLEQRQTSATRERLEKTIVDCKNFLEKMGEKYPQ